MSIKLMDYGSFKKEYTRTMRQWFEYTPEQAGSIVYAEKMSALADEYPDFAERVENTWFNDKEVTS